MEGMTKDAITEDKPVEMDIKSAEVDGSSISPVTGDLVIDMNDSDPLADGCGPMEESDSGQKEISSHNECDSIVDSEVCFSETVEPAACDEVQDDTHFEEIKLDSDSAQTGVDSAQTGVDSAQTCIDSAQTCVSDKSPDTGVDSDLLLLTLDGNSDKHAVLINELQNKEKIISDLRHRVGELEAQLGIMPNMRSASTKRPSSKFTDHMPPSLKRARGRSVTPSRRVSIHLKSLKRARFRSPLCLGSDWNSSDTNRPDTMSQSSILCSEDMDVLAMEVSQRLSSSLAADITAQVLQQVLPLMDLHAGESENNHVGDDLSLSASFLPDANASDVSDTVESYSAENNASTTVATQSGASSSSGSRSGNSSSITSTSSTKIHIPDIFRQRHVPMQANPVRHIPQLPVRHSVGMSASSQFSMNMHRMPLPGNVNSASANAMLMHQLMNTPAGAQAAQALSHLNQMNQLAALQAQQRGIRPQLQNARFSPQVSPLISPRASSAGAGINLNQARNMAINAAFRRAVSSRVVTGQRLNMNNR
ncbi:uncharacterized protein LOC121368005 [Gigantopelta aegis]|uniref:uncharacterized protein LOC121368005 n=1 Tax=Gigantopelta aegis TaxID=1735272 RepID=UPI001B88DDD5|nr:uncharacterized protein LOC121368005 [Gigantopelta aegis]XP_041348438.1 uncharacterized protein LOC121368005 [Gigantopelta aegis]